MAFEQRDNSGALFKNDRKEKESQPDYKGTALIGGEEFEIAAWVKKSKAGNPYMSISFKEKGGFRARAPQASGFHGEASEPPLPF
jgi:uncharacterized protein (DUF736 family)